MAINRDPRYVDPRYMGTTDPWANYRNAQLGESDAARRATHFETEMAANPGAAPGGSGPTGIDANLGRTGARDWTDLMGRQQQYVQDVGRGPMIQRGGYGGDRAPSSAIDALRQQVSGGGRGGSTVPRSNSMLDLIPGAQRSHLGYETGVGAIQEVQSAREMAPLTALQDILQRRSAMNVAPGTPGFEDRTMGAAQLGEDVLGMQSQGEADRYFSPGQKGIRADEDRRGMSELMMRYLRPAQLEADVDVRKQDLDATLGAADIEQSAAEARMRALGYETDRYSRAEGDNPDEQIPPQVLEELWKLIMSGDRGGVPAGGGAQPY